MPTYVYETIPQNPDEKPERFELKQSMNDDALRFHPESGKPVKRVISGGFGYMPAANSSQPASPVGGCGHGSCGGHSH